MPKLFQKIAIGYVLFLLTLFWGMMIIQAQWFPYQIIKSVRDFVVGGEGEAFTFLQKLESDEGGMPHRLLNKYTPDESAGLSPVEVPGLRDRRGPPLMKLSADAPRGYRAIFGAFDFTGSLWGGILIDPDGKVVNTWRLSTDHLPQSRVHENRKDMYGVDMLPDGSVIFHMQEKGGGIVKVDYCSNELWNVDGDFHHTISLTEDGNFWTFAGGMTDFDHLLDHIDGATGKIIQQIDMKDVRAANPHIHIFDLQREEKVEDATHGNDIEALPQRLAADFPQFTPGDLLISFKTVNLVFILDPNTLKIKWWRIGSWDRQHDPDWNPGGYISVFSNNSRGIGDYSNIVTIDPKTFEPAILVDGSKYNFFSFNKGMHQITSENTVLVSSTRQGRAFEVDRDGKIVFEFVNRFSPEVTEALQVSNARFLGLDYFQFDKLPVCEKHLEVSSKEYEK